MLKAVNILLTGASRKVPLIRSFQKALADSRQATGKVICVDMDPLSAGLYIADNYYCVPAASDEKYTPTLLAICRKEQVSMLIPTTDEELLVLSRERNKFQDRGILLIVSPYETISTCNDKFAFGRFLSEHDLPTPATYLPESLPPLSTLKYPLFIKPRYGKGSVDSFRVNNQSELRHYLSKIAHPVIQPFIAGKEYTVDVMCDLSGRIISAIPRERIAVLNGVSQKGRTKKTPFLEDLSARTCKKLGIIGPANIQFITNETGPQCIEVNPRFSGGIPLTLAAGVNFSRMLVDLARGKKLSPALGQFKEGLIMLRYDESIFVEDGPDGYVRYHPV